MTISIQKSLDNIFNDSWHYNNGGIRDTKWRGTNACGVRAMAICCNLPYNKARRILKSFSNIGKANNRRISTGVFREDMNLAMESLGWFYNLAPSFIDRKAYHFDIKGNALCYMPRHFAAIQNGILQDTWNSTSRYIIGYWTEL